MTVTGPTTQPWVQLLVYRFDPGSNFEGQFVGALERIETGVGLRILDAMFVAREPDSGDLVAIDLASGGRSTSAMLGFRLDPAERRRATERALAPDGKGVPPETLKQLGEGLEPGGAIAAVLVEHAWGRALDDAVARMGGAPLAGRFVEASALGELSSDLLAADAGG